MLINAVTRDDGLLLNALARNAVVLLSDHSMRVNIAAALAYL